MSLKQLIQDCSQDNRKAQAELYNLFAPKLYSTCLKYSRTTAEAEDNLQDSFITILNKINQYRFEGSFEGWMRRIVINTALQKYRNDTVFEIIKDHTDAPDEEFLTSEAETLSMDELLKLIQELPDRYRLVFNLYVMDGYNHKEISEMLSITEGTSKSNLARARGILKLKIEQANTKKSLTL